MKRIIRLTLALMFVSNYSYAQDREQLYSNTDFAQVNQGDPISGYPGFIWWHNGSAWTTVDCNNVKLNPYNSGNPLLATKCADLGFRNQPAPPSIIWEQGAIYFSGYPESKWMLISISLSPLTGQKVLTMQYLADPEIFHVFSEDKQTRPFMRVK